MKTLGILGGMSWESTSEYYRLLNQAVRNRLGALHSAKIVLYSVEFNEIAQLQHKGDWQSAARLLGDAARSLEKAGAEGLLLATNTMHKLAPEITDSVSIPLIHIADSTARAIRAAGLNRVGLLATGFTMEQDFYKGHIQTHHGIEVLVPDTADRATVHSVIYDELCQGNIKDKSRQAYIRIIDSLIHQGAQGVILGCTEIGLLIKQADTEVPLFDSTVLHTVDALNWMLDGS